MFKGIVAAVADLKSKTKAELAKMVEERDEAISALEAKFEAGVPILPPFQVTAYNEKHRCLAACSLLLAYCATFAVLFTCAL